MDLSPIDCLPHRRRLHMTGKGAQGPWNLLWAPENCTSKMTAEANSNNEILKHIQDTQTHQRHHILFTCRTCKPWPYLLRNASAIRAIRQRSVETRLLVLVSSIVVR
eukprot:Selendium_serpulae@DN3882_c0_g1_i2.p2